MFFSFKTQKQDLGPGGVYIALRDDRSKNILYNIPLDRLTVLTVHSYPSLALSTQTVIKSPTEKLKGCVVGKSRNRSRDVVSGKE
mmetsp:Transcript_15331/g.27912  ORF Transcript_15331/g.27912 Transcript_15331/m.27912 type:complete len:85 (-) Transcript_15331:584-838(-)